jgi:hypothetical protein
VRADDFLELRGRKASLTPLVIVVYVLTGILIVFFLTKPTTQKSIYGKLY